MFKTQQERMAERNDTILATLKSVPHGLTLREISAETNINYHTARNSIIALTNLGKVKQTAEYRNGVVYAPVADMSEPVVFLNGKPFTLWEYVREIIRKPTNFAPLPAAVRLPYILTGLYRLSYPTEATETQSSEKDRDVYRRDLISYKHSLEEIVANLDILISNDALWGPDKVLRRALTGKQRPSEVTDAYDRVSANRRVLTEAVKNISS